MKARWVLLVAYLVLGLTILTSCPSPSLASDSRGGSESDIYRTDRFRMEWVGLEGLVGGGLMGVIMGGGNLILAAFRYKQFYMDSLRGGFLASYSSLCTCACSSCGSISYLPSVSTAFGVVFNNLGRPKHEFRLGVHITSLHPIWIPSTSGVEFGWVCNVARRFRTVLGVRFLAYPPIGLVTAGFHL